MKPVLTHCALDCRDLERSVAFYRNFCGLVVVDEREAGADDRTVWMAEPGREREFVFVLLYGGVGHAQPESDLTHFGFALASRAEVDAIAERARAAGVLAWPPKDLPFPVGYLCALRDPDGYLVEFSYGQPLGPGAED